MRTRLSGLLALATCLTPSLASAHSGQTGGLVAGFEHPHGEAGARQLARRDEPGGAGADHDHVEGGHRQRRLTT